MDKEMKMMRELIHRLQNPLSVIYSTAQFCLETFGGDDKLREHLSVIMRNVEKASEDIKEFRGYYKK